jgi:hypothetical protein
MILPDKEYKAFLETHLELLFYIGRQNKIISDSLTFLDFIKLDFKVKKKCRDIFLENERLLDDYLFLNFDKLTAQQINILTGFKKKISSDFVIFKCLTNCAIFLEINENKFYAVKALSDRFDKFFNKFPVLITTTILPYNDQIIYDGFIMPTGVYLGSGMTSTINEDYKKAKKNNQILTTM